MALSKKPSTGTRPEPSADGCTAFPVSYESRCFIFLLEHTAYCSTRNNDENPGFWVGLVPTDNGRETHLERQYTIAKQQPMLLLDCAVSNPFVV